MKTKWVFYSIPLIVGLGITFYFFNASKQDTPQPLPVIEASETSPKAVSDPPKPPAAIPSQEQAGTPKPSGKEVTLEIASREKTTAEVPSDAQAELEHALTEEFKAEAMATLPLLTLHTADPLQPDKPGPKPGEIWIRIQPNKSNETRDIMAQVADLYKTTTRYEKPVKVILWIGGQPTARFEY